MIFPYEKEAPYAALCIDYFFDFLHDSGELPNAEGTQLQSKIRS